MLFTLDEILQSPPGESHASQPSHENPSLEGKVVELEDELSQVKAQYLSYKQSVEEIIDARWNASYETLKGGSNKAQNGTSKNLQSLQEEDYFKSYGYLGKRCDLCMLCC